MGKAEVVSQVVGTLAWTFESSPDSFGITTKKSSPFFLFLFFLFPFFFFAYLIFLFIHEPVMGGLLWKGYSGSPCRIRCTWYVFFPDRFLLSLFLIFPSPLFISGSQHPCVIEKVCLSCRRWAMYSFITASNIILSFSSPSILHTIT